MPAPYKLIYIDACVYDNKFFREKGKWLDYDNIANDIFNRSLSCEFRIVISDWLLKELNHKLSDPLQRELQDLLNDLKAKNKIVLVKSTPADLAEAKRLSPDHFQDALHAVLARNAGADVLLTRNMKDFFQFKHLLEIKLPEQI